MKNWLKLIGITILIGTFLGLFVGNFLIYTGLVDLLSTLESKIGIYEIQREQQVKEMTEFIKEIGTLAIENDKEQLELVKVVTETTKEVQKNIDKIIEIQKGIEQKLKLTKTIDVPNIENIKGANVSIYNVTNGTGGSGTHIKIKGKSYILTCNHLIKDIEDFMVAGNDRITLVKYSKEKDLALFEFNNELDLPYLEISNAVPTEGNEVLIVGNPDGLIDVITEGIISKSGDKYYIMTNKIYFGTSGGAILYKGKIIGVATQFRVWYEFPLIVNFAYGCNLETLQEFLAEMDE